MSTEETGVSNRVHELVSAWWRASKSVEDARQRLDKTKTELIAATVNLGDLLAPDDAKEGESFQIWYLDGLLSVKVVRPSELGYKSYEISWRKALSFKSQSKL